MDGGRVGGSPCPNRKPRPQPASLAASPPARLCRTSHVRANPTQGPREEDRGTTIVPASDFAPVEMRGRRITLTDAASRHRGSLTPSPCVGGAVSPGILAATAGPPRSFSAPAAGQWGCCPEGVPVPPATPLPRAPGPLCRSTSESPEPPTTPERAPCPLTAAAGDNVATTAVKPGNHRQLF
jgi:hypothetical protein